MYKAYLLPLCVVTLFRVVCMYREEGVNCQLCDEHGALHQYAYKASSPHSCDSSGYWTPEEAVGKYLCPVHVSLIIPDPFGKGGTNG